VSSIAILGYGYWGNVIHKILLDKNERGVIIFSSRENLSLLDDASSVQPSSCLLDSLSPGTILGEMGVTHLFVCAGPGVNPGFLYRLASCTSSLSVWIEKPFYSLLTPASPFFVDYIYVSRNIGLSLSVREWASVFASSMVCLSVYSKRKYERRHSIHDDFLPHLSSYLSLYGRNVSRRVDIISFAKLDSSSFCCELALPSSRRLVFKYGVSSELSSLQWSSGSNSLESKKLSELFPHPVNENIDLFLSGAWRGSQAFFSLQNLITESFVRLCKSCDL